MALLSGGSNTLMLGLAFLFGGFAFPIYALSIAHANDLVEPGDRISVSSGLLLIFGLGAVAGPVIASAAMEVAGHQALFFFTAAIHIATAAFAFYRTTRRVVPAAADREDFVMVNVSSPEVFHFDPRTPENEPSEGGMAQPEHGAGPKLP